MISRKHQSGSIRAIAVFLLTLGLCTAADAGGGYFLLGYGPLAHQSAGTSTAIGLDTFAGSSNPAKLSFSDDRLDLDMLYFMPHRRIERTGSQTAYDFSTTSKNTQFLLPEAGYAHRINGQFSWGISLFGNGGLNTEYHGTTGQPGTNANPQKCGNEPGNFFLGCGKLGFDLAQVIVAPTLSWKFRDHQSLGISPLLAYQRIEAYGFQAFEAVSAHPEAVTNRRYDGSFGAGARIGWYGRVLPWLDLGAAYSSKIYMQRFKRYRGLIADQGRFDIPANFSLGLAVRPLRDWEIGFDFQKIYFGQVHALSNGVLNSIQDPANRPLGSKNGSGFNWRNRVTYRGVIAYSASPRLTLRAGLAYGKRPAADHSANSASFVMLTPNPIRQVTAGFTWAFSHQDKLHFAVGQYIEKVYKGDSVTSGFGVGGQEAIHPYVNTVVLGWSRSW